jgi:hypothetical protein
MSPNKPPPIRVLISAYHGFQVDYLGEVKMERLGFAAAALATVLASSALAAPVFVYERTGTVQRANGNVVGTYHERLIDRNGDGTIDRRRGTSFGEFLRGRHGTFTSEEVSAKNIDRNRDGAVDRVVVRERERERTKPRR